MHNDGNVCIQNVRFIFCFFEKREWHSNEEPPLNSILDSDRITPESIINLGHFLDNRMKRIADMIKILQKAHSDWKLTGKKDRIIMETRTFDFDNALEILKSKGFKDDEYIVKIEYERKWGML